MPDPDQPLHPLEWVLVITLAAGAVIWVAIILAVRWTIGGGA